MKASTVTGSTCPKMPALPYPNAASRKETIHKLLDFLLMTASGIGVGAMLLFLLANA